MDASSAHNTRTPSPWPVVIDHAARAARDARVRALAELAAAERSLELSKAFEAGRTVGCTDSWVAGAKVGAFCGLLVGLAAGVAGGMFWMSMGLAAR